MDRYSLRAAVRLAPLVDMAMTMDQINKCRWAFTNTTELDTAVQGPVPAGWYGCGYLRQPATATFGKMADDAVRCAETRELWNIISSATD